MTEQMRNLLLIIERHVAQHGVAPTYDEMLHATGLRSKSNIFATLRRLRERGYIAVSRYRVRGIMLLKPSHGVGNRIMYFEWDDASQTLVRWSPKTCRAPERATAPGLEGGRHTH